MTKIHKHIKAPLAPFAVPNYHFNHIHIDLVGSLLPSQGCSYLFTSVDCFTHWPEDIPLTDSSAMSCAHALVSQWVAYFCVPSMVSSDRGTQFTSALWAALSTLLGTTHIRTTAYHPQTNGLVKHFHRTLKAVLCAKLMDPNWVDELPWVLLGVCTMPKEDLASSSAELVYGTPLTVPGDFIPTPTCSLDTTVVFTGFV